MRVRLAVAALVDSVFLNGQENMAVGNKHGHTLPITNYSQFILNQYQEVG